MICMITGIVRGMLITRSGLIKLDITKTYADSFPCLATIPLIKKGVKCVASLATTAKKLPVTERPFCPIIQAKRCR